MTHPMRSLIKLCEAQDPRQLDLFSDDGKTTRNPDANEQRPTAAGLHDTPNPPSWYRPDGEPDDDDIDFTNEWEDILWSPERNHRLSVEEQIRRALAASGAKEVRLPGDHGDERFFITNDKIIYGSGDYYRVETKDHWIWEIDPTEFDPEDYEENWNTQFWDSPSTLFHATPKQKVKSILRRGLEPRSETRGLGNRSVGAAVFTTTEYEEALQGHYGDAILEIDTGAMAALPDRPFVTQEPEIVEFELRKAVADLIGIRNFWMEMDDGTKPDTVIVYGPIPPQFITWANEP